MNIDIIGLASEARRAGTDTPARVAARLEEIIQRNMQYTNRRLAKGHSTSFDMQLKRDNQVLAEAIVLLNNLDSLTEGVN